MRLTAALLAGALIVAGSSANAQTPTTASPGKSTITLERVYSRFLIGPDYRVTSIDGDTGQLAGVSGGWLQEELFYVGGAFYWLVNGAPAWDMHYGGLVVGLQVPLTRHISFGGRTLIGMGDATTEMTYTQYFPTRDVRFGARHPSSGGERIVPGNVRVDVSSNFFVFEPEASVSWKITDRIRFGVSAGYRFTGYDFFDDRLNGASGAATVQFGLGGS